MLAEPRRARADRRRDARAAPEEDSLDETDPTARTSAVSFALVVADAALDAEWDALALATGAAPFLRPGWVRAWMDAFAPRKTLRAATVRRDGALVAVLPVLGGRRGASVPVNAQTPAMEPVAVDAAASSSLVAGLLSAERRVDIVFLPVGAQEQVILAAAVEAGHPVLHRSIRRSPFVRVDGDWATYERQVLSARRRRSLRSRERSLAARGEVEFQVHDGARDLDRLLDEGFALEASGWKGSEGTAMVSRADTARFYRSVAEWGAASGLLRLYVLRVDGRCIAFSMHLEQGDVTYWLKVVHDEEYREHGPGMMSTHRMLAACFARPELRQVDFLGEDERYKLEFATGLHEQVRLQVFPKGVVGALERQGAMAVVRARAEARGRLSPQVRRRIASVLRWQY